MPELAQGKVDLAALVAAIRAAFPGLAFERARLNDFGEDHAVVEIDDTWIFRFPRTEQAAAYAAGERRVLAALATTSPLPIPRYEHVAAGFAGYRKIDGEELTEPRFAALAACAQDRVLGEIGAFLAALHALPLSVTGDVEKVRPTGAVQAQRYAERRPEYLGVLPPALIARVDAFFAALAQIPPIADLRMAHNDFTEDHILLAPGGDRLGGVIDFTDVGPNDPAFDFTFLWAYGEAAPAKALAAYGAPAAEARRILRRSRWEFARYRIEQIWWDAKGFRDYNRASLIGDLPGLIASLGV